MIAYNLAMNENKISMKSQDMSAKILVYVDIIETEFFRLRSERASETNNFIL